MSLFTLFFRAVIVAALLLLFACGGHKQIVAPQPDAATVKEMVDIITAELRKEFATQESDTVNMKKIGDQIILDNGAVALSTITWFPQLPGYDVIIKERINGDVIARELTGYHRAVQEAALRSNTRVGVLGDAYFGAGNPLVVKQGDQDRIKSYAKAANANRVEVFVFPVLGRSRIWL